jgi:hypothetical protein
MKLVRLIPKWLNGMYNEVIAGKHLSHAFSVQNLSEKGYALSPLIFSFALERTTRKVQENKKMDWN